MSIDYNILAAASKGLLEQAKINLQERISETPNDTVLLLQLADTHRMLGDLDSAEKCLKILLSMNSESKQAADTLSALQAVPHPHGIAPVVRANRFIVQRQLLSDDQLQEVWELVGRKQSAFSRGTIVSESYAGVSLEIRNSNVVYDSHLTEIASWFWPLVLSCFEKNRDVLELEHFEMGRKELQMSRHMDGEFFSVHRDAAPGGPVASRLLTFVFYFFQEPKVFGGGDLLLFDSVPKGSEQPIRYTRLQPRNNSLLLFASSAYHQVTPVVCDSHDYRHGRYTLNGWLNHA